MKRLLITLLLALLAVAAVVLWRERPRLFSSSEVSDLYLHYEHNPHIRTTELHSFHINDTLSVDALLLQADSDSAWCELLTDFGASKDLITLFNTQKELFVRDSLSSITKFSIDKHNPKSRVPLTDSNSWLVIGTHAKRALCIFITEDSNQKDLISLTELKKVKQ